VAAGATSCLTRIAVTSSDHETPATRCPTLGSAARTASSTIHATRVAEALPSAALPLPQRSRHSRVEPADGSTRSARPQVFGVSPSTRRVLTWPCVLAFMMRTPGDKANPRQVKRRHLAGIPAPSFGRFPPSSSFGRSSALGHRGPPNGVAAAPPRADVGRSGRQDLGRVAYDSFSLRSATANDHLRVTSGGRSEYFCGARADLPDCDRFLRRHPAGHRGSAFFPAPDMRVYMPPRDHGRSSLMCTLVDRVKRHRSPRGHVARLMA